MIGENAPTDKTPSLSQISKETYGSFCHECIYKARLWQLEPRYTRARNAHSFRTRRGTVRLNTTAPDLSEGTGEVRLRLPGMVQRRLWQLQVHGSGGCAHLMSIWARKLIRGIKEQSLQISSYHSLNPTRNTSPERASIPSRNAIPWERDRSKRGNPHRYTRIRSIQVWAAFRTGWNRIESSRDGSHCDRET